VEFSLDEDNWEKKWISVAKAQLQEFWNTQYKPIQQVVLPTVVDMAHKTEHQIWLEQKRRQPLALDEYVKYC
jgi:hypothetical protein